MAASVLSLKRLLSSNLLSRSLHSVRPVSAPASLRFFNTRAIREYDSDDSDIDDDRRAYRRAFSPFPDVFDPFSTRSSLSQILNTLDQFEQFPTPAISSPNRRSWNAKETSEGLHLRVDMPGLGKEDVKVSVEQNTLIIKGEGKKEFEDEETGRRYSSRVDLPEKLYKTNAIKAEMKNGVLRVFVPKIKQEERSDVYHVSVS